MKYANIQFKGHTEITRERDRWNGEDTCTCWTVPDFFTLSDKGGYSAEPLPFEPEKGKDYWIVYAIWSTGDSFSRLDRNSCECFGIYETYEEAETRVNFLKGPEPKNHGYDSKTGWLPWYGHFENLDELEIKRMYCR